MFLLLLGMAVLFMVFALVTPETKKFQYICFFVGIALFVMAFTFTTEGKERLERFPTNSCYYEKKVNNHLVNLELYVLDFFYKEILAYNYLN